MTALATIVRFFQFFVEFFQDFFSGLMGIFTGEDNT